MRSLPWLRSAALAATVLFAACPGDDGPTEPAEPVVATVTVTPASATLESIGATTQLQVAARDASGIAVTGKAVTWATSAQGVATVSTTGLVTAVASGTAAITATVGGVAGSAAITVSQPKVATVEVTPASPTLAAVGVTVQLTATAKSATGSVITGQTVAWASSNVGIVAVSGAGLATAVTPGLATVTATVGGVVGSAVVTVSAPCANPTRVTLSPGGAQSYDPTSCLLLPSGSSGDRYRVVVLRPTETANASDVTTATLKVVGLGVSAAPAQPAPVVPSALPDVPGLSPEALRRAIRVADATERFHVQLRERERLLLAQPGLRKLAPSRARPALLASGPAQASSPAKITLDITTSGCSTSAANKRTALFIHEDDNLALYQDSAQNATDPITVSQATKLTDYYTRHSKGMIESYFGKPSDVDGNGKVVVFASPVVTGDVAAFVWSGNFFTATGPGGCAASNERELIYFSTDLIQALEGSSPGYQALETVAHEMKHVVSLYHRIAVYTRTGNTNPWHPTWIEEGTAEIAGEMSSRIAWASVGGPAVGAEVTRQSAWAQSGTIRPEAYGVAIKLARTAWYLSSQPNGLIVAPTGAQEGASVYGSGWLFHRWLGDAFGAAAAAPQRDASLFRALNDSMTASGTAGITALTGRTFLDLVDEFTKTVSLHKTATVQPTLDFTTYDMVTGPEIFCTPNPLGVFPWPVTTTGTKGDCSATPRVTESSNPSASFRTADHSGPIGATGMRVHDFLSNGTGTGAQIQLDMTAPAKLWVVRLR
ncbi:MAG TPA: Ig-like domain-containing protein [Longimicrobiales bacterium]|nr:Ig-like domain-containing protein [Longimicrobiales bacterium]